MLRAGINFRPLVEQGQWWRLISANFLHFGWLHVAVNAYSLFAVGPMLERLYGTSRYLAIYVAAGVAGAIASLMLSGNASAGASGALFGLLGTMLLTGLKHQEAIPGHVRKEMRNLALVTLVINLAYGFTHAEIDNYAHLGGLVSGFAMAAALGPNPLLLGERPRRWLQAVLAAFPALAVVGLACSLLYWVNNP
jgi:rhomboid protease GluP